jgi:hypothetical protein
MDILRDDTMNNFIMNLLQSSMNDDAPTQASREELDNLPRRTVNAGEDIQCAVCLSDCTEGQNVISLRCNHSFHVNCITSWLQRRNTCPICRLPISDPAQPREQSRTVTHQTRMVPIARNIKLTFNYQEENVTTQWNHYDSLVDVMKFVSRISGVSQYFSISNESLIFKNTEAYSTLNRSLMRNGIHTDVEFNIINHPAIDIYEIPLQMNLRV